jgi:hypothetical protein
MDEWRLEVRLPCSKRALTLSRFPCAGRKRLACRHWSRHSRLQGHSLRRQRNIRDVGLVPERALHGASEPQDTATCLATVIAFLVFIFPFVLSSWTNGSNSAPCELPTAVKAVLKGRPFITFHSDAVNTHVRPLFGSRGSIMVRSHCSSCSWNLRSSPRACMQC